MTIMSWRLLWTHTHTYTKKHFICFSFTGSGLAINHFFGARNLIMTAKFINLMWSIDVLAPPLHCFAFLRDRVYERTTQVFFLYKNFAAPETTKTPTTLSSTSSKIICGLRLMSSWWLWSFIKNHFFLFFIIQCSDQNSTSDMMTD